MIIGIIVLTVVIVLIVAGYIFNWDWTGLNGYNKAKTLWDWLQLLIIPVVLTIGGFWLNQIQTSRQEQAAEQRVEVERSIARDIRRETALPDYIDKMSELLIEKNLRSSQAGDEIRIIARSRTLIALRELDADRKGSLLRFLYEARLINKDEKEGILNLTGADLSAAQLSGVDLSRAKLSGADLGVANLYGANLSDADLRGCNFGEAIMTRANLSGADLSDADLSRANLSGANLQRAKVTQEQWEKAKSLKDATMPDGSICL